MLQRASDSGEDDCAEQYAAASATELVRRQGEKVGLCHNTPRDDGDEIRDIETGLL